jgi:hypothetical protein
MRLKDVEASGIKRVVIFRNQLWSREGWLNSETPPQRVGEGFLWHIPPKNPGDGITHTKSDAQMQKYIRGLLSGDKNRAWIHGDTLNIVRR